MTEVEVAETKSKTANDFAFATRSIQCVGKGFHRNSHLTHCQRTIFWSGHLWKRCLEIQFWDGDLPIFWRKSRDPKTPSKTRAIFTFATHLFVCQVVGTTTARIIKERISSEPQEQLHHVQIVPGKQMTARKNHKWQYWLVHRGSL